LRTPKPVDDQSEPWRQGYRVGEDARRKLAPSPGPIRDLERLLTGWGIHVGRVEFSSANLDAASLWEQGSLPIILLNTRSIRSRSSLSRRALLAHELCHLLHDSGEHDLTTQLSWGEGANYPEAIEQRARAFAPAFLAPRDEVRDWFRAGEGKRIHEPESKVKMLAKRWGFSLRGAIWHAKNCGIIHSTTADDLDRHTSDRDHEWSDEFERGDRETGVAPRRSADYESARIAKGLLSDLVAEAATTSLISEGRAREILTWG
jgi:Zn-dependent peptidase ImmA (M78 family)